MSNPRNGKPRTNGKRNGSTSMDVSLLEEGLSFTSPRSDCEVTLIAVIERRRPDLVPVGVNVHEGDGGASE
eukprot:767510-Hanusia_phi.AAC.8